MFTVKIKLDQDINLQIPIHHDSPNHPLYCEYPVTLTGYSNKINVKIIVNDNFLTAKDVTISVPDNYSHIIRTTEYEIAQQLNEQIGNITD